MQYVIEYVTKNKTIKRYNVVAATINGMTRVSSGGRTAKNYNVKIALKQLAEKIEHSDGIAVAETHFYRVK